MTTTTLRPMRSVLEAHEAGYLLTRSEHARLSHAWRVVCKRANRPWIVATLGTKWASVRMDMFTNGQGFGPAHDLTDDQQHRLAELLRSAAIAAVEAGCRPAKMVFGAGPDHVSISKCRQEDLEELIAALMKEGREAPVKTRW